MKFLILALLCGLAAANLSENVGRTMAAVERSLEGAGRLWMALDMPEYSDELQQAENRMKTKFGEFLKDALDSLVNDVKDRVDRVKGVVDKVKDKIESLKDRLRKLGEDAETKSKEAIELVRKNVREIVDTVLDSIKTHEENLDKTLDDAAKLKIKDVVRQIREKIAEKVRDIRDYVENMAVDNKAVRELKTLLRKFNDSDLGNIVRDLLDLGGHELRHLRELYDRLKAIADTSDDVLREKLYNLLAYTKTLWHDGVEQLVERLRKVKSSLFEVIGTTKDVSVKAIKEALNHLKNYRGELGDLYNELVEALRKAIGRF